MEGQDGYLTVNYVELVPILIRSIQELKQQLDSVSGNDNSLMLNSDKNGLSVSSAVINKSRLYQNAPNPFRDKTVIRFSLTGNADKAYIYIFDMTGKMQKQISVDNSMRDITINGYELAAGMYIYSLVVNGKEVDTKRMILSN